jgi:hypothetical protein
MLGSNRPPLPGIPTGYIHLTAQRDSSQMRAALDGVAFDGQPLDQARAQAFIRPGEHLPGEAALLAS